MHLGHVLEVRGVHVLRARGDLHERIAIGVQSGEDLGYIGAYTSAMALADMTIAIGLGYTAKEAERLVLEARRSGRDPKIRVISEINFTKFKPVE